MKVSDYKLYKMAADELIEKMSYDTDYDYLETDEGVNYIDAWELVK